MLLGYLLVELRIVPIYRLIISLTRPCKHNEAVFFERKLLDEILIDNDMEFSSMAFGAFAQEWSVCLHFQCAYAPSENDFLQKCE